MKRELFSWLLVLLAVLLVSRELLLPGYFSMHDDTQIARVVTMGKALLHGQFPVRWVSDLGYGYGYPIFNFYGPLPYYVGGVLYAAGLSGLTATKLMMLAGTVLAGICMYVLGRTLLGRTAGVVGTFIYLFAPYRAVNLFVRGAVGEYWAMAFLPLLLLGISLTRQPSRRYTASIIGGLGLAGVILSHTIMGYVTTVLTLGLLVCGWAATAIRGRLGKPLVLKQLAAVGFGLWLSAFFWLPAFAEKGYTNVDSQVSATADFHDHFVCPGQLWSSVWGYGGSAAGCTDGLSFGVGKLLLVLAAIGAIGILVRWKRSSGNARLVCISGLVITAVSVLLLLPASAPLWEVLPNFAFIQYPWRFLSFVAFGLAILGSLVVVHSPGKLRWLTSLIIVTAVVFRQTGLFVPQHRDYRPAAVWESAEDIRYRASAVSDEYLPRDVPRPTAAADVQRATVPASYDLTVGTEIERETYVKAILLTDRSQELRINRAYFPGWEYRINGEVVTPRIENGLPVLTIPGEDSTMQMFFRNTPVRTIGNLLSLSAIIGLLLYYGRKTIA